MILYTIENILALVATIVGLLGCLFRYIKAPKRGYLYLIIFFLASFFSDYYWAIHTLVMGAYPRVSEFLAYLGWNVSYIFLLLAVLHMREEGAKRYFHPVMLLPVLVNIGQFILYIRFGGIFNNIWQVGMTTLIAVFCVQRVAYYWKNRRSGAKVPHLAILVLLLLVCQYGMWTTSCFDWPSEPQNPYMYLTFLSSALVILFPRGAEKEYRSEEEKTSVSWAEFRFQSMSQVVVSVVILAVSAGGYYIAVRIRDSLRNAAAGSVASDRITTTLFVISVLLILLILLLIFEINRHYETLQERRRENVRKHSRLSFISILAVTFVLMLFAVVYNSRTLYAASVTGIYEDGRDVTASTATDLENYLTVAETTLRVAADTVDLMVQDGDPSEDICRYIVEQTKKQSEHFDDNFTGIYGYINGVYMDGANWVPPEGYDPLSRDWYKTAVDANGAVVIVSPYVDAQTGDVVITVAKSIRDGSDPSAHNVVGLDVIVNYVQEVTEEVEIAGKGYGMVVNTDGFIVAHRDRAFVGQNISDIYGQELLSRIVSAEEDRFDAKLDETACMLFTHSIMDQWTSVIVIGKAELLGDVYSQITVNVLVMLVVFWLISLFYYFGYKIEQNNSRKVEEMNMQMVSALAEAIDAKDTYTNGHSSRVAKYSRMIAARAGYSEPEQDEIYMMGLLHDVGKIGVPDEVINKPGKLTTEEYELIKSHPVIGGRILESIKERPKLSTGAKWHHERYGGGGYPDGIAGEDIPEEARIIAVADAYDAMTSRRCYRDVMTQEHVRAEIEQGSGTEFDPRFAKIMISLIDEDKAYSMREK